MKYKSYTRIVPILNVGMYESPISAENIFREDDIDWDRFDCEKYKKAVGKIAAGLIPKFTNGFFDDTGIIGITSDGEIDSPRYYNFETNALVIDIKVVPNFNKVAAKRLRSWLAEGNDRAIEWCIKNYTSYDGFASFIPNKLDRIANLIEKGCDMDILPGAYAAICLAVGGYFHHPNCLCDESVAELNQMEFEEEVLSNLDASDFINSTTTKED